jgi:hypothetical protein
MPITDSSPTARDPFSSLWNLYFRVIFEVSRLLCATQLNVHKVPGSGFNVQRRLWPQALSMIEEETF